MFSANGSPENHTQNLLIWDGERKRIRQDTMYLLFTPDINNKLLITRL